MVMGNSTLVGERCPAAGINESAGKAQEAQGGQNDALQVLANLTKNDSGTSHPS